MLAGLALDLAGLVVAALDRRHEVPVGRDHDERNVGLSRTGDHVLDEVAVSRGINDGVVPLLREELLRRAPTLYCKSNATFVVYLRCR